MVLRRDAKKSEAFTSLLGDVLDDKHEGVKYKRLSPKSKRRSNDAFLDEQFERRQISVPWKAIGLATFLFVAGSVLIAIATYIALGWANKQHDESMWALYTLGSLMFIPGFYHVRIAYYAFKRFPGYTFDDIPDFE